MPSKPAGGSPEPDGVMKVTSSHHDNQPQPTELTTPERLKMTGGAVAQGIRYTVAGEHETEGKAALRVRQEDLERIIEGWPAPQRNVARQMLDKYGPPNEATPNPAVLAPQPPLEADRADQRRGGAPLAAPHIDFLTQYIDYRVPPELTHLVTMSDGSILVDHTRGEVAARCHPEAANVLALNMVHELLTGKRTVEEARHTSEQNTVAYNAGRAAPYAERLLFEVPQGGTEDLDQSHLSGSVLQQAVGKLKDALTPGGREEASDRRTPG
jgi:hypothetical protein